MKIGLIIANYNDFDLLQRSLPFWLSHRAASSDFLISIVDGLFLDGEVPNSTDGALEYCENLLKLKEVDFFQKFEKGIGEAAARNVALKPLLESGCDYIMSTAADEFFDPCEIQRLFNFVKSDPFAAVFKINYKNLVFTKDQYLEGFCPNRLWAVKHGNFKLEGFNGDDDVFYKDVISGEKVQDKNLSVRIVPKSIVFPRHETWLNNERSRKKVDYQSRRWAPPFGFGASFKWDSEKNELQFNEEYYKLTRQSIPQIFHE